LKDGSGYDFIKLVKDSRSPSKIIVISAYDGEQRKALQKGANLFLAKPFTKQVLKESLQKLDFRA
jgi:CheY-like chemotaxis protein